MIYISIHAAREGGDGVRIAAEALRVISIHAAREGGDETVGCNLVCDIRISIHAAREGGDVGMQTMSRRRRSFQSTPPVKAATQAAELSPLAVFDFNPRRP